jgi:outer membrane protein insertion porin family
MRVVTLFFAALLAAASARAQTPGAPAPAPAPAPPPAQPGQVTVCGQPVAAPETPPPAGSGPVVFKVVLCFEKQGGYPVLEANTYLYYIQLRPSAGGKWVPFDESTEQLVRDDFKRLWATSFLDDLAIRTEDYPFSNGVIGKMVVYDMEERERVKIVDYEGLKKVDQSKIEEKLKEKGITIKLDSFIDPGKIRSVTTVVRELYAAEGYQFAEVKPETKAVEGGTKLVHVTFHVTEGPKVRIRDIDFVGNKAVSDGKLNRKMKENKEKGFFGFITGGGTYKEDKFADDAQLITDAYRDEGFIMAQVGQPQMRTLEDSPDGRTRWIQLQVPITEGKKYAVGNFDFDGNKVVKSEALRPLFKLEKGETYSQKKIKKGLEKAQEIYGSGGYMEFTAYPDLKPRDVAAEGEPPDPTAPPIVDVTVRVQEGAQYFINRITFNGNTHTRDDVIRREMALYEAGVFNTEALKYSLRRLNQLGYFKPLEGEAIAVEKAPGQDNKVDVEVTLEEQNRNQVSFGAGASQYEGFFGNASYTTSNFLGRGESVTFSAQKGSRSGLYQIAFTEPYLFGKPITAGFNVFSRKLDYQFYSNQVDYSEVRTGFGTTGGWSFRRFTRLLVSYGYELVDTAASNALETSFNNSGTVPFLEEGRYTQSSITPSIIYNTVDNPYAPRNGMRLSASYQNAGGILGGTTHFIRPEFEAIVYRPITGRTAIGVRAQAGWITNYSSRPLPYYLRIFMGGDTQIRGTELRSVGPKNAENTPLGGTKFVLFNAEYYYDILPQVRALLFHDAGQSFLAEDRLNLRELRTSSGAELRVTLPVIGVPFRLIYAWNVYRDTTQPARTFRFAVGTTF